MPDNVRTFWAIVPAKDPALSKSRLAPVLPRAARHDLALRLLERTLSVLAQIPSCVQRVVISAADEPLALAQDHGALALHELRPPREYSLGHAQQEPGDMGGSDEPALNAALEQAARYAAQQGAEAVLVLPADLPTLEPSALSDLLQALHEPDGVVLAPDRASAGTNALLARPPLALPFRFGAGSFERHCALARRLGIPLEILEHPALALDLDTPEDLAECLRGCRGSVLGALLDSVSWRELAER
jgi:2-phospho-L-lactate guanylyltransferase